MTEDKMTLFYVGGTMEDEGAIWDSYLLPYDTPHSALERLLAIQQIDCLNRDNYTCDGSDAEQEVWCDWCKDHADKSDPDKWSCDDNSECEIEEDARIESIVENYFMDVNVAPVVGYDRDGNLLTRYSDTGGAWQLLPIRASSPVINTTGAPKWDD